MEKNINNNNVEHLSQNNDQKSKESKKKATVCMYDGKEYSVGAQVTLSDGSKLQCYADGTWA